VTRLVSNRHPGTAPSATERRVDHVVAVLGVLIPSAVVDKSDFGTQEAWFDVTLLLPDHARHAGTPVLA
jgi:hypothetical protein